MEENKNSFWKSALIYGAMYGAVLIVFSIITYVLNMTMEKWVQYVSYVIMIGALVYFTMEYRKQRGAEGLSYGQALGFGVAITLVASVISAIYTYLLFTVIDPDLINLMIDKTQEQMLAQGLTDEQVEAAMEMQKKFMEPWIITAMSIPSMTFMGFIIALISSIFLKKEPVDQL